MTIDHRIVSEAAISRLRSSSDARVAYNIDQVVAKSLAADASARPGWVDNAARTLKRYRAARFGADKASLGAAASPAAASAAAAGAAAIDDAAINEAVARAVGRPVYFVRDRKVDLTSGRTEAEAWQSILSEAAPIIERAIVSVGRIEVENYSGILSYVGTGWLIDEDLIVTNRHVALFFSERDGAAFRFQIGRDRVGPVRVKIDYREEYERPDVEEMSIERIVWVSPTSKPDIALLKIAGGASPARRAIPLSRRRPDVNSLVGVIGYPARDYDFWDRELLTSLFGDIYDKKRFAPGNVLGTSDLDVDHDCTTLGGNSGSVVLDLGTGEAVGLHYSGVPLIENRAVPATVVAEAIRRARSQQYEVPPVSTPSDNQDKPATLASQGNAITLTIPLQITISLGGAQTTGLTGVLTQPEQLPRTEPSPQGLIAKPTDAQVEAAVAKAKQLIGRRDDVVAIRAGYRFEDGYITDQPAVVIAVKNKQSLATLDDRGVQALPRQIDGIPTDVTNATIADIMEQSGQIEAPARRGHNYKPRLAEKFKLKRFKEPMKATLHTGPDSGWPHLKEFLGRTSKRLTIGMFEYTAPHVVEAGLAAIAGSSEEMQIVIQKGETIGEDTKKFDIPDEETVRRFKEAKGNKFRHAWASLRFKNGIQLVNDDGIFDSSYHIKVAVRDGKEFWLSSGSWQSSNQPPFDPIKDGDQTPSLLSRYNREWHAIIEHTAMSVLYEEHLKQDFVDALAAPMPEAVLADPDIFVWVPVHYFEESLEAARIPTKYFPPLVLDRVIDVQPVLSPDNYLEETFNLIKDAEKSIFFQNQSFKIRKTRPEGYDRLLSTLLAKQKAGVDVRIIFRPFQDIREDLEAVRKYTFDMTKVKLDTKCHNKGIIVDSKKVILGSHNWTNAGTSYNRDASLIFNDREIAEYFEKIYLYDWSRAKPARIDESVPAPRIAGPEEAVPPPGMVKVRLSDLDLD